MKIKKALAVVNDMQAAGVIGRYAIGGAVGATFYLEPVRTLDVDIFVAMLPQAGGLIITPSPIYDYLIGRGYEAKGEYIMVEDWPVQFLPPTGPLLEEAIAEAREAKVEDVKTYVISAEHLVAIALETGRGKDKARILQFLEMGQLNDEILENIIKRHGLTDHWQKFQAQFVDENS